MDNSLYKYVEAERLRSFLDERKIRFTQPGAFNDPFELVPRLLVPSDIFPKGHRSYEFGLTKPRRPLEIDYEKVNEDRCSDHHARELRHALDRKVGFLCLSRTWQSLTMWAHYADQYAGAVIEFDGDHEFFRGAFDIHYSSRRPIRDLMLYLNEEIPIAEMCEKPLDWKYEQEVRLARALSDCERVNGDAETAICVAEMPISCIKRVILGERFDQSTMIDIFRMIRDTKIEGDWAILDHWSYEPKLNPFKFSYPSGGRVVSSIVFRNYRDFPNF